VYPTGQDRIASDPVRFFQVRSSDCVGFYQIFQMKKPEVAGTWNRFRRISPDSSIQIPGRIMPEIAKPDSLKSTYRIKSDVFGTLRLAILPPN